MRRIVISACFALGLTGIPNALAQGYPVKPIRLITPYPPGGGIDASARIIGQALSEHLGQQVIIDNRPGATGRIGTELAAKSPADGYTLLLGSSAPNAIIPAASPTVAYDAVRDFVPISLVGKASYVLVVHPSLPAHSVMELIALAKANPGKLTFASSGVLGASHLAGELLGRLADVSLVHVAYKGTGPAAVSVLTGETVMSFAGGAEAAMLVAAKRLRALGTTGSRRAGSGLPALSETLPGYDVTQWYGLLAPAGTPQDILDRLHKEIVHAIANPKVAQQFTNLDIEPVTTEPREFSALIKTDMEKWAKVIKAARIPVD
jgi:tripartite-type tricarboxylate transporter receptor subunit TctC